MRRTPASLTHMPRLLAEIVGEFVDILIANEDEARSYTGETDPARALEILHRDVDIAVLKLGAHGSMVARAGRVVRVPALSGGPIVDTTGAGDLWAAGFLVVDDLLRTQGGSGFFGAFLRILGALVAVGFYEEIVALGLLTGTFETAVTWDRFPTFHESVSRALADAGPGALGPGLRRRAHRASKVTLDLVEHAYRALAAGRVELPPKPGVHPRKDSFLHAMPAYLRDEDVVTLKPWSRARRRRRGGGRRHRRRERPRAWHRARGPAQAVPPLHPAARGRRTGRLRAGAVHLQGRRGSPRRHVGRRHHRRARRPVLVHDPARGRRRRRSDRRVARPLAGHRVGGRS